MYGGNVKNILLPLLLLSLSAFFVSCGSSSLVDLATLKTELNLKNLPEQKDYPESDGVVLYELHDVQLRVNEEYGLETVDNVTRVIKLFRDVDRYATVTLHIPWSDKLTDISARTIKPDGTIINLKGSDFHKITGIQNEEIDYSNIETVKFTFPAVQRNSIIEYHYSLYSPHPFLQTGWMIQGSLPKLETIYKLTASILVLMPVSEGGLGWNWRYQWHNCDLGDPQLIRNITPSNLTREKTFTYKWVQKDVPPFVSEPMMPPESRYLQYVEFAPADWKTWDDVSKWYNKYYFAPQLIITDKIREKAESLTAGCRTEREKIAKLYSFVEGLRYVAIELGDGGYMPDKPQTVLDNGYGDCKDKSILLISLLRSLQINAKPVLLLTTDEGKVYPHFPSWDFNHMIVKVKSDNGRAYWLDPTVRYCRLREIPYPDQGAHGLVLNDNNTSQLETIPSSNYKDNIEAIDMNVDLKNASDAEFHIKISYKGEYNFEHRYSFSRKTPVQMMKYCKSLVADDYLNAEVTHYSVSNLDSVDSPLTLSFDLKVPNAISKQGNLVFLNIDPFKLSDNWGWLGSAARLYDIEFDFPSTIEKTIHVTFPADEYEIRDLPEGAILQTDGLYYENDYKEVSPGSLKATEELEFRSKELKVQHLDRIKDFVQNMQERIGQQIVLKGK